MNWFEWNPCLATGLEKIDDQHHRLVDLINQFGDALLRSQGASAQDIATLFDALTDYAVYHFREEEGLMGQVGVAPEFIAHHAKEHAQFLEDLTQLHAGMAGHNQDEAHALIEFLTNWLAFHILGSDQVAAWLINAARKGIESSEALQSYHRSQDPATATLLHAVNRLFSQVSERNRTLYELNRTLEERVQERTQALSQLNQRLEHLAMTDVLTGLPNRRSALLALQELWCASSASDAPMACMMIDADGFKGINDTCGHDAGDEVLRQLSRRLKNALRTDDQVFRLGGDEFLVICRTTALDVAMQIAEKVRKDVASLQVHSGACCWKGSVSVGVAVRTLKMQAVEDLLKTADEGVYAAKRNGRNCVATAQVLMQAPC